MHLLQKWISYDLRHIKAGLVDNNIWFAFGWNSGLLIIVTDRDSSPD